MGLKDILQMVTFLGIKNRTSPYGNFFYSPCLLRLNGKSMILNLIDKMCNAFIMI